MNFQVYHQKFEEAAATLALETLQGKNLRVSVTEVLRSVALKLYKDTWANVGSDSLTSPSRIFFSTWVNDETLSKNRVYYNIHALKLRHLTDYKIESRKFAESFRLKFRKFEKDWPNVKTAFGPLTLMEGWQSLDEKPMEVIIAHLAVNFIAIEHLIDDTLAEFIRTK